MKPNKEQLDVINSKSKNILVSASAGSGKTTVMMERVINLVDETAIPLKNFVIVTFTKDAANDMKKKLREKLVEKLSNNEVKNEQFLRQELFNVASANISTLHSFCQNIIKSYFEKASVSPSFNVIDEIEASALRNECMNNVFNTYYENKDTTFLSLLSALDNRARDESLINIILDLYSFVRTQEKPIVEVINNYLEEYDNTKNSEGFLIEYFNKTRNILLDDLKMFEGIFNDKKIDLLISEIKNSLQAKQSLDDYSRDLDNSLSTNSIKNVKAEGQNDLLRTFKEVYWDSYKKYKKEVLGTINKSVATFRKEAKESKGLLSKIFEILQAFDLEYSKKKQDLQVLDFNDLERKMLDVLQDETALNIINDTFKYIFVDEYQDINYLQENILARLAENNNLLMVGDAKQSIYGFRQCKPEIFLNKRAKFIDSMETDNQAIELNQNYRSKKDILDFVNAVFKNLMKEDFSGINYQNDAMLKPGLSSQEEKEDKPVEIDLIKKESKQNSEEFNIALIEKHINEIIGKKFFDIKQGIEREYEPNDICILARKNQHLKNIYLYFLKKGINLDIKYDENVDDTPEVSVLHSLVKTISNPKDDINFIATIRNIYGVNDSELLELSRNDGKTFYDKALKSKDKRIKEIIDDLKNTRFLAQSVETSDILYSTCLKNGYFNRVLQMNDGTTKKEKVESYILSLKGKQIVSNIFRFAESVDDNNVSISIQGSGNGIKLRTIHACKGLEYPVVILSNAGGQFRGKRSSQIIFDRDIGVGYNFYNHINKTYCNTIVKKAIIKKIDSQEKEEELRLLYVALTRARNKLIIIGEDSDDNHGLTYPLRNASDYMPWIKLAADKAKIYSYKVEESEKEEREEHQGKVDEDLKEKLLKQLSFKYKYLSDTTKSRKTSVVSFNKHNIEDLDYVDYSFRDKEKDDKEENKAERGTAYHKFLEHVDFNQDVELQLNQMKNNNVFTDEESKYLDKEKLGRLVKLDIFRDIGKSFYREHPFMMLRDDQIIQGIIDMFYIKDDKAYIIDYKYSSLDDKQLKETYSPQLNIYKEAIESLLNKKVEKMMLLNLNTETVIEL